MKRLKKSHDFLISGVCGGIAKYFDVDPTIVRLIFVLGTLAWGTLLIVYIALIFIMPEN